MSTDSPRRRAIRRGLALAAALWSVFFFAYARTMPWRGNAILWAEGIFWFILMLVLLTRHALGRAH